MMIARIAPIGRFREGPHYGLPDGCVAHKLRAHEHPRLALNGVAPHLVFFVREVGAFNF